MALTDEQLLDAALIDLDNIQKRRLITLLRARLLKVNNQLKKQSKTAKTGKDFVTTGTGVQPTVDLSTGPFGIVKGNLQEQADELQRKLAHAESSLRGHETVVEKLASSSAAGAATGGYKYVLPNEQDGIVQLFNPGAAPEDKPVKSGYLIYQAEPRAKPKVPGAERDIFVSRVVDPEQFTQTIFNEYFNDPEATIAEKRRLISAGFLPSNTIVDGVVDEAFRTAFNLAAAAISTENYRRAQATPRAKLFTLDSGLDFFIQRGGVTGKTTTTAITVSTKDEAYATLNEALRAYLGREATEEELGQFTAQLNAFERANPAVRTTTGTGTTVTGGAAGAMGRMATEFARSQEGSAAFRAGTYYYDALLDAIDNPLF